MIDLPPVDEDGSVWVFGYGSLMWNPGFAPADVQRARIHGYQRRFCIYSVYHRGSAARPGLVLGLDRGGTCEGLALRIPVARLGETLAYLRAREQINGVYRETRVHLDLKDRPGHAITAIAFTAEREHPSYTGRLGLGRQAALIKAAAGRSGGNLDYLFATLQHLEQLGIRDAELTRLAGLVGPHFASLRREPDASGAGDLSIGQRMGGVRLACQRFPVRVPLMRPEQRRRFTHRNQIILWHSQER